ncbi:MAG: rubrerythrin family protein [Bacteroidales bacterium]|nr:rubrerythrin family protein [Bacteroidales bacterium]MBK7171714.1 rubrerythrin family protein [Bacteroidales bacterium]
MSTNEIKGTQTERNLMAAFVMESQAYQKYLWFAKVANKEGFQQMEAIFAETAEQKKSHCKTLFRFLDGCEVQLNINLKAEPIAGTLENLVASAAAETEQEEKLYSEFEKTAWEEGFKQAATKLKLFRQIKKFYASRFNKLAENIREDKVFKREGKVKWICRKCGLIYESDRALKNCPGCEHPQAYFEILAENY